VAPGKSISVAPGKSISVAPGQSISVAPGKSDDVFHVSAIAIYNKTLQHMTAVIGRCYPYLQLRIFIITGYPSSNKNAATLS
jgi:hypothetical protein